MVTMVEPHAWSIKEVLKEKYSSAGAEYLMCVYFTQMLTKNPKVKKLARSCRTRRLSVLVKLKRTLIIYG